MELPIAIYDRVLGGHYMAVAEYLAHQYQETYAYDPRVQKWYRKMGEKTGEKTGEK